MGTSTFRQNSKNLLNKKIVYDKIKLYFLTHNGYSGNLKVWEKHFCLRFCNNRKIM